MKIYTTNHSHSHHLLPITKLTVSGSNLGRVWEVGCTQGSLITKNCFWLNISSNHHLDVHIVSSIHDLISHFNIVHYSNNCSHCSTHSLHQNFLVAVHRRWNYDLSYCLCSSKSVLSVHGSS